MSPWPIYYITEVFNYIFVHEWLVNHFIKKTIFTLNTLNKDKAQACKFAFHLSAPFFSAVMGCQRAVSSHVVFCTTYASIMYDLPSGNL